MAPVLIPVALAVAAGGAGIALGVTTFAAAALSVAVTAAAAAASYLMAPSVGSAGSGVAAPAAATQPAAAPANGQRNVSVQQSTPPRRMLFGNCRAGGALIYQENNNPFLYTAVALSDGRIEGVDAVYFGAASIPVDAAGDAASGTAYEGRFTREWSEGATDQAASTLLLSDAALGLTSAFRQRGVARLALRLHWGADATQHQALWGGGVNPSALGRWSLVYDPRDAGQDVDDAATWTYSDNPAICTAHVMRFAWGVGVAATDIDWPSVTQAANDCDATLTYGGDTVKRFRLAGAVQADVEIGAQIAEMLTAMDGRINYADGLYRMAAGVSRSPVWTITDDDLLELGEYQHEADTVPFNTIAATFFDISDAGSRRETGTYADPAATTEGERKTVIALPFTPDSHSAQIIAFRELARQRNGRRMAHRLIDAAAYLEPGDVVTVALTYAPFMDGDYEVVQVDMADEGVQVALKEYVSEAFADPATYLV